MISAVKRANAELPLAELCVSDVSCFVFIEHADLNRANGIERFPLILTTSDHLEI